MLNNTNYKEILLKNSKVILLIGGEGCANCLTMYPIINQFVNEHKEITFYNIEVDENVSSILEEYSVEKVPSVLLFEAGNLLAKISGYQPYEVFDLYVKDKFRL